MELSSDKNHHQELLVQTSTSSMTTGTSSTGIPTGTTSKSSVSNSTTEKVMRCAKCLNHGELVPVKGNLYSINSIIISSNWFDWKNIGNEMLSWNNHI